MEAADGDRDLLPVRYGTRSTTRRAAARAVAAPQRRAARRRWSACAARSSSSLRACASRRRRRRPARGATCARDALSAPQAASALAPRAARDRACDTSAPRPPASCCAPPTWWSATRSPTFARRGRAPPARAPRARLLLHRSLAALQLRGAMRDKVLHRPPRPRACSRPSARGSRTRSPAASAPTPRTSSAASPSSCSRSSSCCASSWSARRCAGSTAAGSHRRAGGAARRDVHGAERRMES